MKYVIYYRVSTKKQGDSGLGLEAQEQYIGWFLEKKEYEIIASFTDVKSGVKQRDNLDKAVALCKSEGAELLIAKLDRVGRDVAEIAQLMKDITLRVASMPHADNFQLHIYAALAEQERTFISERTKRAISAKAKRELDAGNTNFSHGQEGRVTAQNRALAFYLTILPHIKNILEEGYASIARSLNNRGIM